MNKYLYKYQQVNKNSIEILINNQLYFAKPGQFNDPFDGQILPKSFIQELEVLGFKTNDSRILESDNHIKDLLYSIGVLCLSRKWDDILMWSHYSDAHKGLCFGFKKELQDYFSDTEWGIEKRSVDYKKYNDHPFKIIHKDVISGNKFSSGNGFVDAVFLSKALFVAAITIKHYSWRYEKEERLISDRYGLHYFRAEALDHVILGMNTPKEDEMTIRSLLAKDSWKHVRLFKTRKVNAKLAIERYEIF